MQECCSRKTGNSNMTPSEESMTLMTSYHFPHHGNRSFAIASGWRLMVFFITAASLRHRFGVTLIVSRHSERWQECCSRKTGNRTVTQSEESMILMTSYRFPHHRYRAFTFASDDVWLSAYPHSYKNTVPITSDEYRILCFLSYFLTLAFRYAFGEIWEPYTSR